MKILKVEFENINSLAGHWTVDFESREIRESGLLLISGETGAGKTTILDAICLGLYGQTARVEKDASSAGHAEILSNGTLSSFSEVTFEGNDGNRYRMRWSKRRKRATAKNPEGTIEKAERSGPFAVDAAGNAVGPELEKPVDELIGLSFEQFRKTVILPQGEFAEFMKGEDKTSEKQRSDILEKLTGTEIYRQISQKVFELTKAEKEKLTALESALSGVKVLSSEERAALEASLARLESELPKAEAELSRWEAAHRWFEDEAKLTSELTAAEESEAKSRQDVEAFAPERTRLEQAEKAGALLPLMGALEDSQKRVRAVRAQIEAQQAQLPVFEAALAQADRTVADRRGAKETAAQAEEAARPQIQLAIAKEQEIAGAQKNYGDACTGTAAREAELNKASRELKEAQAAQAQVQKQAAEVRRYLEAHAADEAIQGALPEIHVREREIAQAEASVRQAESQKNQAASALANAEMGAKARLADVARAEAEVRKAKAEIARRGEDIRARQADVQKAKEAVQARKHEWEEKHSLAEMVQMKVLQDCLIEAREREGALNRLQSDLESLEALARENQRRNEAEAKDIDGKKAALAEAKERAGKAQAALAAAQAAHEAASAALEASGRREDQCQAAVEEAESRRKELSALLQLSPVLEETCECPLCRTRLNKPQIQKIIQELQTRDSARAIEEARAGWKEAQAERKNAERTLKAADKERVQAEESASQAASAVSLAEADLKNARANAGANEKTRLDEIQRREAGFRGKCGQNGVALKKDKFGEALKSARQAASDAVKAAERALEEGQKTLDAEKGAERAFNEAKDGERAAANRLSQAVNCEEAAKTSAAKCAGNLETARANLESAKAEQDRCAKEVKKAAEALEKAGADRLAAETAFQSAVRAFGSFAKTSAQEVVKQLTARRDEWLSRTQAKQEADKRLEGLNASVEASERAVIKADAAWADAHRNADARRKELEALREARKSILGGEDVEAVQKRLNEAAAKAERAFEDAQMKQQRASSELTSCQTTIETQKQELNEREREAQAAEEKLSEAVSLSPFDGLNAVKAALLDKAAAEKLRRQEKTLSDALAEAQGALRGARDRREEHARDAQRPGEDVTFEEAAARRAEFRDLVEKQKEERAVVTERLEADRRANDDVQQRQREIDRQRAVFERWDRLSDLVGSKNGDAAKFSRFAQGLTLSRVIALANEVLPEMTNGRYAFWRTPGDTSLSFQVIDREMDGVKRPTSNLSGGETFIASLSLAIALTRITARGIRFDSLFLDEGFGTLDSKSLALVMGALRTLRDQGKTVGLISHVESLESEISARIRAVKKGQGRSILMGAGVSGGTNDSGVPKKSGKKGRPPKNA